MRVSLLMAVWCSFAAGQTSASPSGGGVTRWTTVATDLMSLRTAVSVPLDGSVVRSAHCDQLELLESKVTITHI